MTVNDDVERVKNKMMRWFYYAADLCVLNFRFQIKYFCGVFCVCDCCGVCLCIKIVKGYFMDFAGSLRRSLTTVVCVWYGEGEKQCKNDDWIFW